MVIQQTVEAITIGHVRTTVSAQPHRQLGVVEHPGHAGHQCSLIIWFGQDAGLAVCHHAGKPATVVATPAA